VTPNDSTDLAGGVCRGIYVGGSGDVTIHDTRGNAVTFVGMAAGVIHPIQAKRILDTGTDATDLVAVY